MNHQEILAGLIVLLYLSDCLRLLHPGAAALCVSGDSAWRVLFGSSRMVLAGKDPLLANPFDPSQILFIVAWRGQGSRAEHGPALEAQTLRTAAAALRAPGWTCWISWTLALLALPALLLLNTGPVPVIVCACALYLNITLTGLLLYARRSRLGVSAGQVAKIWGESVLCAPFGANMARKLALALPTRDASLALLGSRLLDDRHKRLAWQECRERLVERMAEFDEGTPEYDALGQEAASWRTEP